MKKGFYIRLAGEGRRSDDPYGNSFSESGEQSRTRFVYP